MPTPRKYNTGAERAAAYRLRRKQVRLDELQAKGLPALPPIPAMPGTRRWSLLKERAQADLETMRDEMQGYYDDRSEAWQESDRGAAFQERLDQLEVILDELANMEG